jgi:oligopeptide transport system permease protein
MLVMGIALLLIWPWLAHPAVSAFVPEALTWSPETVSVDRDQAPGWQHWLGTDVGGRDLLSRIIHGTRVTLGLGVVAAGISALIGVGCGVMAGALGGRWDAILMRIVDGIRAVPAIVLVLVLIAWLESPIEHWLQATSAAWLGRNANLLLLCGVLGAVSWPRLARVVRDQLLVMRRSGPIEAARVLGAGPVWIWTRHILPNLWGKVLVALLLTVPAVMLYETIVSYFGLGVQPPQASLGSILAESMGRSAEGDLRWWLVGFPAATLIVMLISFQQVGTGIRAACQTTNA